MKVERQDRALQRRHHPCPRARRQTPPDAPPAGSELWPPGRSETPVFPALGCGVCGCRLSRHGQRPPEGLRGQRGPQDRAGLCALVAQREQKKGIRASGSMRRALGCPRGYLPADLHEEPRGRDRSLFRGTLAVSHKGCDCQGPGDLIIVGTCLGSQERCPPLVTSLRPNAPEKTGLSVLKMQTVG